MKVLGITGGVGSGKSLALSYLERKDKVVVYEADKIAKLVQSPGTSCFRQIVAYFGEEILQEDGALNRKKLGNIVFQDKEKLERLNEIVHPVVRERILELMELHRSEGTEVFVIEAAILLESKYEVLCDQIWYIYCEQSIRLKRLQESRNYSEELFAYICKQQMAEELFREKCQVTIDNSSDELHLQEQIDLCLQQLYNENV